MSTNYDIDHGESALETAFTPLQEQRLLEIIRREIQRAQHEAFEAKFTGFYVEESEDR